MNFMNFHDFAWFFTTFMILMIVASMRALHGAVRLSGESWSYLSLTGPLILLRQVGIAPGGSTAALWLPAGQM